MLRIGTALAPWRDFRTVSANDPFRELMEMQRNLSRFFGRGEGESEAAAIGNWTPAVDIYEDESQYLLKVELPEVEKEDVKVGLENNVLSITGTRKFEHEDKRDNYHRVERAYGQFMRSFTLPNNVNPEGINAEYKNGILRLSIPKREEAKPKQIEVSIK